MSNKIFYAEDDAGGFWKSNSFKSLLKELEDHGEYVSTDKRFFIVENPIEINIDYKIKGDKSE